MNLVTVLRLAGYLLLIGAAAYVVLALLSVWWRSGRRRRPAASAPVSVLKPLCGAEPRLYENLRSFCVQNHPHYQIVFGLRDAEDPALAVAQRLRAEYPQRDIAVVVDPRIHGVNLKVSNVMNLLAHARHDWLVLADSDIAVTPDYLARVTAPLARDDVGLVTCLYRGRALGGFWSRLGVQFIDDWFRPAISLAQACGAQRYAFGATLALRRETLTAIGGFEAVADRIADDYCLGELIAERGLSTLLSDYEVVTDVVETRFGDLIARELRWLRTIRSVRPLSFLFVGVCFTLPVALAGVLLCGAGTLATALAASAIAARFLLFLDSQRGRWPQLPKNFAAFLFRDILSVLLWACALSGDKVRWRGRQLEIDTQAAARASA